jgi:DNA polymerase III psi subunit
LHKETKKKGGKTLKMSIDNIIITPELCESLYTKSLIEKEFVPASSKTASDTKEVVQIPEKINIKSLGNNKQQIIFLVNDEQNLFLADEDMKLLTDLLTACKISMADIALINYYSNPDLNLEQLLQSFHPKKLLMFGVSAKELGLSFNCPFFEIKNEAEQTFMTSPLLAELKENISLKKQLWTSLKKIFLLK